MNRPESTRKHLSALHYGSKPRYATTTTSVRLPAGKPAKEARQLALEAQALRNAEHYRAVERGEKIEPPIEKLCNNQVRSLDHSHATTNN